MKKQKYLLFLVAQIFIFFSLTSCSNDDDIDLRDFTVMKIEMKKAGTLSELIKPEHRKLIGDLTISGPIDGADLSFMNSLTGLSALNLEDARLVPGAGYYANVTKTDVLPSYAFAYVPLNSITLPSSLLEIGSAAFYECGSLQKIVIPDNLTKIESEAFYRCESLKEIRLPSALTYIGSRCFIICSSLETVYLSGDVSNLNANSFSTCSNLKEFVTNNTVNVEAIDGVLYSKDKTVLMIYPPGKSQKTFTIPEGVIEIQANAFLENINIESVIMSDNIEVVGESAFRNCRLLSNVEFSKGLKTIKAEAFNLCFFLTKMVFPESLTLIEEYGVSTSPGYYDTECHFLSKNPPVVLGSFPSNSNLIEGTVYIPVGSRAAYQSANPWNSYHDFPFIEE